MSTRLALCLLLTFASYSAGARDVRQAGANGDGGVCPEELPASVDETAPASAGSKRAPAVKSAPAARGGDNQSTRPPRWHSFLPGMFR